MTDGPNQPVPQQVASNRLGQQVAISIAAALTLPAIFLRLTGTHPAPVVGLIVFGIAVVGAAFLMAWGAEALQVDVSRGLALAVLALIAVLPEDIRHWERISVAIVYMVLATFILFQQRRAIRPLLRDGFRTPVEDLIHEEVDAR